jgi:hypothetical protein
MTVELCPSFVRGNPVVKQCHRLGAAQLRERHCGADEHDTVNALGVVCGEHHRALRSHRPGDHDCALRLGGVQHGKCIGGEFRFRVRPGLDWPVRPAVPTTIERDHPAVP